MLRGSDRSYPGEKHAVNIGPVSPPLVVSILGLSVAFAALLCASERLFLRLMLRERQWTYDNISPDKGELMWCCNSLDE